MTATPHPTVRDSLGREYPALPTAYSEVWIMPRRPSRARLGLFVLQALAAVGLVFIVLVGLALVKS